MHTLLPIRRPSRLLPWLLAPLLLAAPVPPRRINAQTDAPAAAVPVPPALPSPAPGASPAPAERTVYTPYEKLEQVFEKEDRGVFLPYREFLDLWNKLNLPADLKKNLPPVDGVLASARYTGHLEGDAALFDAQLQFEALKDGWSKVPLGGADLNIAEVRPAPGAAASQAAPILHLAGDGYEAILPARGSYPVALTVLGKVSRDAGRSTLELRLPRTAASQFELTLPETGLDFTLAPASAFTTHEENGATRLTAFFGATQQVSISWHQRAAETTLPALVFADSTLETVVSPGALRTAAAIDFRLLRAPVGAFEILVPAGQQVLGVDGAGLRDWNLAPATPDSRQHIVVNLATPAREHYKLRVTLEAPVARLPARLTVPAVEIARAEGQSGTITVSADPALAITVDPREGVTQASVAARDDPPKPADGALLGAYRFLHLPYAIDLDVRPAEPVVEVKDREAYTVTPDTLSFYANLEYSVKKAGIFSALIDVPAALEHVEASPVESYALVPPAPGSPPLAAGYQRLEVRFKQRVTDAITLEVTGDFPRAKPDDPVTVAVLHPVAAAREEGQVGVGIHQSLDPKTTDTGDLRQESIDRLNVPFYPTDAKATPLTLGFNFRGASARPAQLVFTVRKPRVSAEVASRVSLRESLVAYQWTVRYNIEYAGIDDLVLDAPPDVAEDLQFSGDDIKEKVREDEKDAAGKPTGRRLWHIRLQGKKLGRYDLKINLERALPPLAAGKTATVDWPELKTVGLFHETGTVAVVKDGNLEITRATPTGLELIDPAELPDFAWNPAAANVSVPKNGPGDIFLAYRYAAHPAALRLEFSKNEFLPVPTAIVTYAVLNTTLTVDRAGTTEAIYWVRNNGRQFLSVVLPERGQMLSDVFVNGQPQQPSRRPDRNALLVRLPARGADATANDAPVSVRLVFSVPGEAPGRGSLGLFGRLRVVPPVLEDTRVMQAQVSLYLPAGYRYVHFDGPMREADNGRGWNRLRDQFDSFVPALGPDETQVATADWQPPPDLPPAAGGGFDSTVPKEGTPVVLRRLDAPAPVEISYRSLGYANTVEAVACFLALGFGLALLGSPRGARLAYFFVVGLGALILAGAVAPRAAGLWTAVYLGVFVAALVWLATGFWRWLRRLGYRWSERRRLLWLRLWAVLNRPVAVGVVPRPASRPPQDPPPPPEPPEPPPQPGKERLTPVDPPPPPEPPVPPTPGANV